MPSTDSLWSGRDEDTPQQHFALALTRVTAGRDARSLVLTGAGADALAGQMAAAAEDAHWLVGSTRAAPDVGLRPLLTQALQLPMAALSRPGASEHERAAVATFASFAAALPAGEVPPIGAAPPAAGGHAGSGEVTLDVSVLVRQVSAAANARGVGLALLIEQAHQLSPADLTTVCMVAHMVAQRRWPVLFVLTGEAHLPVQLHQARGYAERLFTFHSTSGEGDART